MEYDRVLIEQSIAKQYGVLPSEQENLKYSDWAKMVSGLMDDTPLGRIVSIRCEDDKDIIKNFGPEQWNIRSEWTQFRASKAPKFSQEEQRRQIDQLEKMIAETFGGGR